MRSIKGMTLPELLVAMAVLGAAFLVSMRLIVKIANFSSAAMARSSAEMELKLFLSDVLKRIRERGPDSGPGVRGPVDFIDYGQLVINGQSAFLPGSGTLCDTETVAPCQGLRIWQTIPVPAGSSGHRVSQYVTTCDGTPPQNVQLGAIVPGLTCTNPLTARTKRFYWSDWPAANLANPPADGTGADAVDVYPPTSTGTAMTFCARRVNNCIGGVPSEHGLVLVGAITFVNASGVTEVISLHQGLSLDERDISVDFVPMR